MSLPVSNKLFILLQYITPQHLLTYIIGKFANSKNKVIKNLFINTILKNYPINLSEALDENLDHYDTFNDFFIRRLKPHCRPISSDPNAIVSPADGKIAELGRINKNLLLQAKNMYFNLETLLGGDEQLTHTFCDGHFITIYLAPHNYHRVHMPITGTLEKNIYIPGKLFSVNKITTDIIPQLYTRNERLVTIFNTDIGKVAVILVGAMIVGCIKTANKTTIEKGEEMGYFEMGSTVILLFEKNKIMWNNSLHTESDVFVGKNIGEIINQP